MTSQVRSRSFEMRPEQLDEVNAAALEAFVPWVEAHVRQHFTRELRTLDDARVRALVRDALRRGYEQGLRMQLALSHFVDLCIVFGVGFEDDPKHTWVQRARAHAGATTPDERVIVMMQYAIETLGVSRPQPPRRGLEDGF